eukprot:CAMPEP_0113546242 /NCGR_PEP_ID=MMETSP0015_2-20120614/11696_1 /TAXON_ID=2838 /ORGANISM="Odontella" /LENGTH=140 /DNA_ID=CAMNT_0000446673 /DNA_START=238 /DNA_END=660 /DNA_ORIENTATION=+ /assembly_acc=CAM_ASM_000160
MKLSVAAVLFSLGAASAFAPANVPNNRASTALNAESSRKAFLSAAAASLLAPAVANAGTMAQENVFDPTEQWETGSPTASAEKARMARYTNARTQLNSNFAPQKRLTLERKSPVTRLDINAPNFEAYKKTFPGLYKTVPN